ncbi:nucleotidyltransferase family protein [Bacillus sp. JJ634]
MDKNISLELALIPKELKLIKEIIKKNYNPAQLLNEVRFKDINWNLFIEQSLHHRVYPLLFSELKKAENQVPLAVLQTIQYHYKRNTFEMLHLTSEMKKVNEVLMNNQIRILFLKGPMLGSDLYGDISLRTSSDLDVLVPLKSLEKVEMLLIETGYIKDDYFQTVLSDWKWRHHHLTFYHPEKKIKLEVHWRLNPGPGKEPSFEKLWDRKRISSITSFPIYTLGKEDLFLFLVTHGARHGWSRLRWLVDIHQILKQNLNWPELKQLLKKYHYLHIGGQAIILCSQLLGTSITKEMKPVIQGNRPVRLAQEAIFYLEKMVNLHTEPVPDKISKYHQRHLYSLMSTRQKFLYVLSWMYPFPIDVETLPLPPKIHFFYFPLRPLLCAWRKTRR